MPEVPNLHPLFVQLQTRYPTSGLLTELVQMHADHFVVRAIVQLGSITLATSLAMADTVEQAEDQARLRVLALLGIDAGIHPAPFTSLPERSFPSASTPAPPLANTFKDTMLPPMPVNHVVPSDKVTPIALPDGEPAIVPPSPFPPMAFEPALVTEIPKEAFSTAAVESSEPLPDLSEMSLEAWDASPPNEGMSNQGMPDELLPDQDGVPYDEAPYDGESFEEPEPLGEEALGHVVTSDGSLPAVAEEPAIKSRPRKPVASKEPPVSEADTSGSASRDLSSLISQIGVEIERIGWSKRQGSTYLQKTYGKKTRSELTDDELEDFLTYLNTQPSASEDEG